MSGNLLVNVLPQSSQREAPADTGISPGKRSLTQDMQSASPAKRLALAREALERARLVHLPQLRLSIATRAMEGARIAAAGLRSALADASAELRSTDRETKAEREDLRAERDALREEAEPLLKKAPPPRRGEKRPPWELLWGEVGEAEDKDERDNEKSWKELLDREEGKEREMKSERDQESARLEDEPDEIKRKREHALDAIADQAEGIFAAMIMGAERAKQNLDRPPKGAPALWETLLDLAATAAIAATGTYAATRVAATLLKQTGIREKVIGDAIKDPIKKALKDGVGSQSRDGNHKRLVDAFFHKQQSKLMHARAAFVEAHWLDHAEDLYRLDLDSLETIARDKTVLAQDPETIELQERNTTVEWINFVAQAHHGTPQNADEPGFSDENTRNIRGSGIDDHMDKDQRKLNEDMHGVLEVHLFMYPNETFARYTDDSAHGLRIDGVSDYVRDQLRNLKSVGDAPINKVISIWYEGASSLNPPKPGYQVLVTADGAIGWTSGNADIDQKAKAFANSLPLDIL